MTAGGKGAAARRARAPGGRRRRPARRVALQPAQPDRGAAPVARPGGRRSTRRGCANGWPARWRCANASTPRPSTAWSTPRRMGCRAWSSTATATRWPCRPTPRAWIGCTPALLEALAGPARAARGGGAQRRRGARPRRAGAGGASAARRRRGAGAGGGRRARLHRGPARRAEDRLVLRPAREPRPRGPPGRRRHGAGRLLPHRRLRPPLRRRRRVARRAARPQRPCARPRGADRRGERAGGAHGNPARGGAGGAGAHGKPPAASASTSWSPTRPPSPRADATSRRRSRATPSWRGWRRRWWRRAASCSSPRAATTSRPASSRTRRSGASAARGGRRRILFQGGAGPDHPVHPMLPESAYLKAMLFQLA